MLTGEVIVNEDDQTICYAVLAPAIHEGCRPITGWICESLPPQEAWPGPHPCPNCSQHYTVAAYGFDRNPTVRCASPEVCVWRQSHASPCAEIRWDPDLGGRWTAYIWYIEPEPKWMISGSKPPSACPQGTYFASDGLGTSGVIIVRTFLFD